MIFIDALSRGGGVGRGGLGRLAAPGGTFLDRNGGAEAAALLPAALLPAAPSTPAPLAAAPLTAAPLTNAPLLATPSAGASGAMPSVKPTVGCLASPEPMAPVPARSAPGKGSALGCDPLRVAVSSSALSAALSPSASASAERRAEWRAERRAAHATWLTALVCRSAVCHRS